MVQSRRRTKDLSIVPDSIRPRVEDAARCARGAQDELRRALAPIRDELRVRLPDVAELLEQLAKETMSPKELFEKCIEAPLREMVERLCDVWSERKRSGVHEIAELYATSLSDRSVGKKVKDHLEGLCEIAGVFLGEIGFETKRLLSEGDSIRKDILAFGTDLRAFRSRCDEITCLYDEMGLIEDTSSDEAELLAIRASDLFDGCNAARKTLESRRDGIVRCVRERGKRIADIRAGSVYPVQKELEDIELWIERLQDGAGIDVESLCPDLLDPAECKETILRFNEASLGSFDIPTLPVENIVFEAVGDRILGILEAVSERRKTEKELQEKAETVSGEEILTDPVEVVLRDDDPLEVFGPDSRDVEHVAAILHAAFFVDAKAQKVLYGRTEEGMFEIVGVMGLVEDRGVYSRAFSELARKKAIERTPGPPYGKCTRPFYAAVARSIGELPNNVLRILTEDFAARFEAARVRKRHNFFVGRRVTKKSKA